MLRRLRPVFERLLVVSIVAALIGSVLVGLAEFGDVHEARIFGASLIVLGGLGIGTATGLADPRSVRVPAWLADWRLVLGLAAVGLAAGPVAIVLIATGLGLVADASSERSLVTLGGGAVIAIFFLAMVVLTAVESTRRIVRATHQPSEAMTSAEVIEGEGT